MHGILDAFQKELAEISSGIAVANKARKKEFRAMDPIIMESSVSI